MIKDLKRHDSAKLSISREPFDKPDAAFPVRLYDLVCDTNLSMSEIGKELNISRQAMSKYCKAEKTPTAKMLVDIADYFNTTPDYLLGYSNCRDREVKEDIDAFNKLTGMSEASIKKLIAWNKDRDLYELPSHLTTIFNKLISDENASHFHASLSNLRYFVEHYQIQKKLYETQDESPIVHTEVDENGEEFTFTIPITEDEIDSIKENIELYIWKASKDFSNFLEAAIKQELGDDIFNDLKSREYPVPVFK